MIIVCIVGVIEKKLIDKILIVIRIEWDYLYLKIKKSGVLFCLFFGCGWIVFVIRWGVLE